MIDLIKWLGLTIIVILYIIKAKPWRKRNNVMDVLFILTCTVLFMIITITWLTFCLFLNSII